MFRPYSRVLNQIYLLGPNSAANFKLTPHVRPSLALGISQDRKPFNLRPWQQLCTKAVYYKHCLDTCSHRLPCSGLETQPCISRTSLQNLDLESPSTAEIFLTLLESGQAGKHTRDKEFQLHFGNTLETTRAVQLQQSSTISCNEKDFQDLKCCILFVVRQKLPTSVSSMTSVLFQEGRVPMNKLLMEMLEANNHQVEVKLIPLDSLSLPAAATSCDFFQSL